MSVGFWDKQTRENTIAVFARECGLDENHEDVQKFADRLYETGYEDGQDDEYNDWQVKLHSPDFKKVLDKIGKNAIEEFRFRLRTAVRVEYMGYGILEGDIGEVKFGIGDIGFPEIMEIVDNLDLNGHQSDINRLIKRKTPRRVKKDGTKIPERVRWPIHYALNPKEPNEKWDNEMKGAKST